MLNVFIAGTMARKPNLDVSGNFMSRSVGEMSFQCISILYIYICALLLNFPTCADRTIRVLKFFALFIVLNSIEA